MVTTSLATAARTAYCQAQAKYLAAVEVVDLW